MSNLNLKTKILMRNDTSTNWTTQNPVLSKGELGFETDTRKFKIGDAVTAWSGLQYASVNDIKTGSTNGTISVDGDEVAVKGLGSAAYLDRTAFDPAGLAAANFVTAKTYTDNQISSAIGALDVSAKTGSTTQTITSISETDGKIAVTYSDIATASATQKGITKLYNEVTADKTDGAVTPSAVYTQLQELQEQIQGKPETVVISALNTSSEYVNSFFNNSNESVGISSSNGEKFLDVENNPVLVSSLKVGDVLLLTSLSLPDRYVTSISSTGSYTFAQLETRKIDLSSYVTNTQIQAMDYSDTAESGKYVSKVDQVDGVISVTRETIPVYTTATAIASGTTALSAGGTIDLPVSLNKQGNEITLTVTKATLPADNDTKNTAGSTDTSSKIYLIGATSQAANPQTYSQDTTYVGTDGCLYSDSKKVATETFVTSKGYTTNKGTVTSVTADTGLVITNTASVTPKVGFDSTVTFVLDGGSASGN